MVKKDNQTLDIFHDYQPPKVVARVNDESHFKEASLSNKIAMAVSMAMSNCALSREEIAAKMSKRIGQNISVNMLDNYASQAKSDHKITLERFIVFLQVVGAPQLLSLVCEPSGYVAVPAKYEKILELWEIDEAAKKLEVRRNIIASGGTL